MRSGRVPMRSELAPPVDKLIKSLAYPPTMSLDLLSDLHNLITLLQDLENSLQLITFRYL